MNLIDMENLGLFLSESKLNNATRGSSYGIPHAARDSTRKDTAAEFERGDNRSSCHISEHLIDLSLQISGAVKISPRRAASVKMANGPCILPEGRIIPRATLSG